jgi:hypothetical protein
MGILESLLGGNNQQLVRQLANTVGLDEASVNQVVNQLMPVISKSIQQNIGQSGAVSGLLNSLGQYQQYVEQPERLAEPVAIDEGNAVLGEVFGSKDVSRQVASHVAEKTNVDSSLVKQLLPMAATIVMGSLSQKVSVGNNLQSGEAASSDISAMLVSFLDSDNDGDISDDLINLAKKFF